MQKTREHRADKAGNGHPAPQHDGQPLLETTRVLVEAIALIDAQRMKVSDTDEDLKNESGKTTRATKLDPLEQKAPKESFGGGEHSA